MGARFEIFAHRGASATHPENTMPAFVEAARIGVDGVELDVQLSADDVPVVIHDPDLNRTTDGRGPVRAVTAARLARLDAGTWFGDGFAGTRVPMLEEVLDWATGNDLALNIELKADRQAGTDVARRVVEVLAGHGFPLERVVVSAFDHPLLADIGVCCPPLRTAVLFRRPLRRPVAHARGLGASGLHPYWRLATPRLVTAAAAAGLALRAWTVNVPRRIARLAAMGVDAVLTDRPGEALAAVRVAGVAR